MKQKISLILITLLTIITININTFKVNAIDITENPPFECLETISHVGGHIDTQRQYVYSTLKDPYIPYKFSTRLYSYAQTVGIQTHTLGIEVLTTDDEWIEVWTTSYQVNMNHYWFQKDDIIMQNEYEIKQFRFYIQGANKIMNHVTDLLLCLANPFEETMIPDSAETFNSPPRTLIEQFNPDELFNVFQTSIDYVFNSISSIFTNINTMLQNLITTLNEITTKIEENSIAITLFQTMYAAIPSIYTSLFMLTLLSMFTFVMIRRI